MFTLKLIYFLPRFSCANFCGALENSIIDEV